MKEISLSHGMVSIVDDEDFEYLNQWRWTYTYNGAVRFDTNHIIIYMHRFIMKTPKGMETDHINHNRLDNRRENLRICTIAENQHNSLKHVDNTSGFKGVCWDKNRKRWYARISMGYYRKNLGRYLNVEDAARAYDDAARKYYKEFACTNFKEER
jgi:hypothetical protein